MEKKHNKREKPASLPELPRLRSRSLQQEREHDRSDETTPKANPWGNVVQQRHNTIRPVQQAQFDHDFPLLGGASNPQSIHQYPVGEPPNPSDPLRDPHRDSPHDPFRAPLHLGPPVFESPPPISAAQQAALNREYLEMYETALAQHIIDKNPSLATRTLLTLLAQPYITPYRSALAHLFLGKLESPPTTSIGQRLLHLSHCQLILQAWSRTNTMPKEAEATVLYIATQASCLKLELINDAQRKRFEMGWDSQFVEEGLEQEMRESRERGELVDCFAGEEGSRMDFWAAEGLGPLTKDSLIAKHWETKIADQIASVVQFDIMALYRQSADARNRKAETEEY